MVYQGKSGPETDDEDSPDGRETPSTDFLEETIVPVKIHAAGEKQFEKETTLIKLYPRPGPNYARENPEEPLTESTPGALSLAQEDRNSQGLWQIIFIQRSNLVRIQWLPLQPTNPIHPRDYTSPTPADGDFLHCEYHPQGAQEAEISVGKIHETCS